MARKANNPEDTKADAIRQPKQERTLPLTNSDRAAGFEILPNFRPFSQQSDVFSRSFWDPAVRSEKTERFYRSYRKPLNDWRKAEGFTQKDYAVRNAAWHVTDILQS